MVRQLEDLRDHVVIVRLGDFAVVKLAGLWRLAFREFVHEYLAVNLRSVHGSSTFEQQVRFLGNTFEKEIEFPSHKRFLPLLADLALDLHQVLAPTLSLALWNLVLRRKGACALLVRVTEGAHPIELRLPHELAKFLKLFLSFSRKTNDERAPQGHTGDAVPHFLDKT